MDGYFNSRWIRLAPAAVCVLLGIGCAHQYSIPQSFTASSQAQVGTLLVSPTMVAPWDEVSASLKPAFVLTGDQAAALVLPVTESISEQVLSSFGASLAAGLPTVSTTSQVTTGGPNPGATSTTTKAPGSAPTIANSTPSGASLPGASGTAPTLGLDPALKYKAANYLLQEVQLLNQEIDNAAARTCYVPYVVKLKLATANFRPRLPYSVHSHIGFFYNGALASNTRNPVPGAIFGEPSGELAPECRLGGTSPVVIPFLAADDVQAALKSRAAEAANQIAFGLSAMIHGAGLNANLGSLQQNLTAISNHDLTSTLTVGRESESSLYVLISPNNQASDQASLTAQTYDVAVLLLIPRFYFGGAYDPQSPTIAVSTFTEYRNANSGELLTDGSPAALVAQAERVIPRNLTPEGLNLWNNKFTDGDKYIEASRLAFAIKAGSPSAFIDLVRCASPGLPGNPSVMSKLCKAERQTYINSQFPAALWAQFSSLLDYDTTKLALFQVQLPAPIKVPTQRILLSDDGTHPIQAVLGGVTARSVAKVAATLKITPFDVDTWKPLDPISIAAQALVLDTTAHTLTLTFPSLKKMNVACLAPAVVPPRPTSASKESKNVKPKPDPSGKSPAKPQQGVQPKPGCPSIGVGGSSASTPNAILLHLIGCDISKQICPSLTTTETDIDQAGQSKLDTVLTWQSLVKRDSEVERCRLEPKDPSCDGILHGENNSMAAKSPSGITASLAAADGREKQLAAFADKMKAANAARVKLAALELDPASRTPLLANEKAASDSAWRSLKQSAFGLGLVDFIEDDAILGVSLFTPVSPSDPPTVAFSDVGATIEIDKGSGEIVFAITPTPTTDTIGLSVTGASLKAVVDSTGSVISFTAKHGFVLPQAGVYTLSLTGLNPNVPVILSAQALKGDSADGSPVSQKFQPTMAKPAPDSKKKDASQ